MSQSTAVRAPRQTARPASAPRQATRPAAPRLRVVAAPEHTRSRAGLVVACLSLLVVGLVSLLVLNVSLERGAYELRSQRAQTAQLTEQRQALQESINAAQAPAALAAKATALGMVAAPNAAFIRRSDGAVLGVPLPGVAVRAPTVTTRTAAATSAASPSALPSPSASVAPSPGASSAANPGSAKPGPAKPSPAASGTAKAAAGATTTSTTTKTTTRTTTTSTTKASTARTTTAKATTAKAAAKGTTGKTTTTKPVATH